MGIGRPKIIGISSTKGGSGKSTCAYLICTALGVREKKVLIIDTDIPQYTSYSFFANRSKLVRLIRGKVDTVFFDLSFLATPDYNSVKTYLTSILEKNTEYDYIVLDGGGYYSYLSEIIIEFSNILVTPMNLSSLDFNILFQYDSNTDEIKEGNYSKFVRDSKDPNKKISWYVIPNRCHPIITDYQKKCMNILKAMGDLIGYKVTSNLLDRTIYSQGFDMGITCFDNIEEHFSNSHLIAINARREVNLIVDQITKESYFF